MSIINFRNRYAGYYITFTLGEDIQVFRSYGWQDCRIIKPTRKGFNILNLQTSRCLLKKHLYARGMSYKEYPEKGSITAEFLVPSFIRIKRIEKQKVG